MLIRKITYCIILTLGFVCLKGWTEQGVSSSGRSVPMIAGVVNLDPKILFRQMEKAYRAERRKTSEGELKVNVSARDFHYVLHDSTLSRFEKLEALFEKAKIPQANAWGQDVVMMGRCVHKWNPEQSMGAFVDLYVLKTRSGRKRLYFVPSLDRRVIDVLRFRILAARQHSKRDDRVKRYSPLMENLPSNLPLGMMLSKKLKNMLLFTYNTGRGQKKDDERVDVNELIISPAEESTKLGEKIFHGMRILTMPDGRRVLLLKQMCGSYPQCGSTEGSRYIPFGEPYMYCYYNKGFRVPKFRKRK